MLRADEAALTANAASFAYRVSFDNAAHHEARISVAFRDIGEALFVVRMSRSSPAMPARSQFPTRSTSHTRYAGREGWLGSDSDEADD